MKNWNSSPHPISDIRDWHKSEKLMLQPDYQRREVWSPAARIMLIDTILRNIPMPKIFVSTLIKDERTYRTVIDGQQRISAILGFLRNEFCLKSPYNGEYKSYFFNELPLDIREEFLSYIIDFNEFRGVSDAELREVYSRVNKYTDAQNKQELRRADFPGDFLKLSEKLALDEYLEDARIFSLTDRRRLGDVEFISELLAALINDVQDKKQKLDDFYQNYAIWDNAHLENIKKRFSFALEEIKQLFSYNEKGIAVTRFRQKSDFYSLFLAIDVLHQEGYSLEGKSLDYLQQDLRILDLGIEPHSDVNAFREYATRCLSDANSKSSRFWRMRFIKKILSGTYIGMPPTSTTEKEYSFTSILFDLDYGNGFCKPTLYYCCVCNKELQNELKEERLLVWTSSTDFQLSNAKWIHTGCYKKDSGFYIEKLTVSNQQNLFEDENSVL